MRARFSSSVNPRLKTLDEAAKLQPAEMKAIATQIDYLFRQNETQLFKTEGASGAQPWPALSARYAKWKRKHSKSRKIMVLTGRTRKSLVQKNHPEHILTFGGKPPFVTVGTSVETAAYHINESPLKNPNVPERDVLAHTAAQIARYYASVRDYFAEVKLPRVRKTLEAARNWGRRRVA